MFDALIAQTSTGFYNGTLWDIISACGTLIAGGGLIFTGYEFIQNRKAKQDALTDEIFKNLMNLETLLGQIDTDDPKYDFKFKNWFSAFANTLEYLAFRINNGVLMDQKRLDFIIPAVISYYENIFVVHGKDAVTDEKRYEELKKLYRQYKDHYGRKL